MNIGEVNIDIATCTADGAKKAKKQKSVLQQLSLAPEFLQHLKKIGFGKLTQIQEEAIPILTREQDAIIISRTGSGKTLAYLIPMVHKLGQHSQVIGVRGLVLAPTRELAVQINMVFRKLVKYQKTPLRCCLITGGESLEEQFNNLTTNPDVIIATPGRLLFHMSQIINLREQLRSVSTLIVDECDQMFEQQLQPQVSDVMGGLSHPQIVLCSATFPKQLRAFSSAKLDKPVLIQKEVESFPETLYIQNLYVQGAEYKETALVEVLQRLRDMKTLVFVATKYHCEYFVEFLQLNGITCKAIYGALDQGARNALLKEFREGQFNILVATDVAARGIDIDGLQAVVNYNFPFNAKMFLHRGGRCARNGQYGIYVNVVDHSELPYLVDSNLHCGTKLRRYDFDDYLFFKQEVRDKALLDALEGAPDGGFYDLNKETIRRHFSGRFDALVQDGGAGYDELQAAKKDLEGRYRGIVAVLKRASAQTMYESYVTLSQVAKNANLLKLDLASYTSCLNDAMVKSRLNNQIATIPQHILDLRYNQLQNHQNRFIQARQSMQNSLQQLNKQRKAASEASVQKAHELSQLLKQGKHYLINYFEYAQQQGFQLQSLSEQLDILHNYKTDTMVLRKHAQTGDAQSVAMYKMRQLIERHDQLKRYLSQSDGPQRAGTVKIRYNDPQVVRQMDEEIRRARQEQRNAQQLVSATPQNKMELLDLEVCADELSNVKGQFQKKVWDPQRMRYVNESSMKREKQHQQLLEQDSKGKWVAKRQKSLYEKWVKKAQKRVGHTGQADTVDDRQARMQLQLQGLNRLQKAIVKNKLGVSNLTTAKDKLRLQQQLNDNKHVAKKTKASQIGKKAEQLRERGLDWKKIKDASREKSRQKRQDYKLTRLQKKGAAAGKK